MQTDIPTVYRATYKTQLPEIDVIVTNQVDIIPLNGQYFVFEVDTVARECPDHYGPYSTLESALERAAQSVEEIRIIATATVPDELEF